MGEMRIIIAPHTLEQAIERGASETEIVNTINEGQRIKAKNDRLGSAKVFGFRKERNGKFYEEKKIEVIFVIEDNQITTVTVYVYYGKWT
jgi:hypothetical protein